tara:strand:+ start:319 stop:561 length:243 start_codon:yes stop_codon:yes gene_type:complete
LWDAQHIPLRVVAVVEQQPIMPDLEVQVVEVVVMVLLEKLELLVKEVQVVMEQHQDHMIMLVVAVEDHVVQELMDQDPQH